MTLVTCLEKVFRMDEFGYAQVDFCCKYNKETAVTIRGGKFYNTLLTIFATQECVTSSSHLD